MKYNLQKGFTLVEITIALFIIVSVGSLIVGIFFSTLRGTNKSNVLALVKQDGTAAITQMAKMIRYAKSIDVPTASCDNRALSSVIFTSYDERQTTFQCPATPNSPIASVSGTTSVPLLDANNTAVVACSFRCYQASAVVPQTVTINFTLRQRSTTVDVDQSTTIPFETSVTIRNFFR